jgi:Domain of unknown function (DUF6894)
MKRYYFDLRDDDSLAVDEEGLELPGIQAVQEEAARSLVDMTKSAVAALQSSSGRHMAIEVRDDTGPVLQVRFTFEMGKTGH